jgi:hypothetical protein
MQWGAEVNAWVTKHGAYGVLACLQLNLLDGFQAALLIVLHLRLHGALREASEACNIPSRHCSEAAQGLPGWWALWKLRRLMSCLR